MAGELYGGKRLSEEAYARNFSITGLREGENDLYLKWGFGALFGNVKAIA
jgi:hypothetical protein